MSKTIEIAGITIGPERPVFIVAEIGLNHNGDPGIAAQLIRTAAAAGVNAVKFQKRDSKALLTRELYNAPYDTPHSFGTTYGAHREALELSIDNLSELRDLASNSDVAFLVSAWDLPSVDACESLGIPAYKVASADVTNTPLLERIGETGKPVIMSTGMSTEHEVSEAVATIRRYHDQLALLHCVSTYPSDFEDINLATIPWLAQRFDCPTGYSGHERGIAVSSAAVGMGACIIERHITLDRTLRGPDHAASLEPPGLMKLVRDIRAIERSIGSPKRAPAERELPIRKKLGKSLVAARDLPAGHVLTESDLVAKSPGTGLPPLVRGDLMGKALSRALVADEQISAEDTIIS